MDLPAIEFHPNAVAEGQAARWWYAARSPQAAAAFTVELDRAVEVVASAPMRWPIRRYGTRHYRFDRFPYSVIYRFVEAPPTVQILAIAHGKRRPYYWKGRL